LRHSEEHESGLQPSEILWLPKTQADGLGWYDHAPSVLAPGELGNNNTDPLEF
jgi:hypothetical protein